MAIEVIVRHEYNEQKYLIRCCRCQSVLRFAASDLADGENLGNHTAYYSLVCPVCDYINILGLKGKWVVETERLKGELDGNQSNRTT